MTYPHHEIYTFLTSNSVRGRWQLDFSKQSSGVSTISQSERAWQNSRRGPNWWQTVVGSNNP